jgi:CRISPR/Cas system-associated exonuclease Cas4 (RecB family)
MSNSEGSWWLVDVAKSTPDRSPDPPVTPTGLEALRSCPLSRCYARSTPGRYPQRMVPSARIGTAVHSTIERIGEVATQAESAAACAQTALEMFRTKVEWGKSQSFHNPRERNLVWPEEKLFEAENSIIRIARLAFTGRSASVPTGHSHHEFECALKSKDGMIAGIADHIELFHGGVRITDYKTSLSLDDIDKHRNQLLLYAYLYFDSHGDWPSALTLDYVLMRKRVPVEVDREIAIKLADEARTIAASLPYTLDVETLARPGPACKYCSYRPWCQPYWRAVQHFEIPERFSGIQGVVRTRLDEGSKVLLSVEGQANLFDVRGDSESVEQLGEVHPGMTLRIVDASVYGVASRPTVELNARAELFAMSEVGDEQ